MGILEISSRFLRDSWRILGGFLETLRGLKILGGFLETLRGLKILGNAGSLLEILTGFSRILTGFLKILEVSYGIEVSWRYLPDSRGFLGDSWGILGGFLGDSRRFLEVLMGFSGIFGYSWRCLRDSWSFWSFWRICEGFLGDSWKEFCREEEMVEAICK